MLVFVCVCTGSFWVYGGTRRARSCVFTVNLSPPHLLQRIPFIHKFFWVHMDQYLPDKENMTEKGWCIQEAFYYKPLCCPLVVLCASSACNVFKIKSVLPLRNDKYENYVFGTQRPLSTTAGRECSAHCSRMTNHARICIMSSGASVCSWINLWMALYGSVMNRRADYTRQMMHT